MIESQLRVGARVQAMTGEIFTVQAYTNTHLVLVQDQEGSTNWFVLDDLELKE